MHRYPWQTYPPLSSIDQCKTTSLNHCHILKHTQIPMADLPPSFKHVSTFKPKPDATVMSELASLAHHYTNRGTDSHGRPPPLLLSIDHWNTTTLHHFKKYGDSTVQAHYHFTSLSLSLSPRTGT